MTEWEPCGRGVCAANEGHEGTCAGASGWVEEPLTAAQYRALRQARALFGKVDPILWQGDNA